jgi:hypothetical protein
MSSIDLVSHYKIVDAKQEEIEKLQKRLFEYAEQNHKYHEQIEAAKQIVEDEELWNHHEPEVRQLLRNALLIPRKEEKNGFVKLAGLMKKENTTT